MEKKKQGTEDLGGPTTQDATGSIGLYDWISQSDLKKVKMEEAAKTLKEIAVRKVYSDLLTGEYNKTHYPKLIPENRDSPFPPHMMDFVFDGLFSTRKSSFDHVRKYLLKDNIQDKSKYEEALFTLCLSKKHEWVSRYRSDISFKPERLENRRIIEKVV